MTTSEARAVVRLAPLVLLLLAATGVGAWSPTPTTPVRAAGPVEGLSAVGVRRLGLRVIGDGAPVGRQARPTGEQHLRLVGPRDGPPSLAPATARDLSTAFLCRQVFRGLTRFDDELQPVPELAERIEISADGLTYTFHLRPTATFHDGRSVTADDVVFSLTHALSPAAAGGDAALLGGPAYLSDIVGASDVVDGREDELRGARVVDERTVELRLTEARATFLMKLAGVPASIIDPADVAREPEWWRSPNGSGPFRVVEWEPDERLTLEAFDDYHAGPPPLTRIEFLLGDGAAQPFNLYQAGAIDVASVPTVSLDRVLDPRGDFFDDVTMTPLLATHYLAFRNDAPPMDDPHVRRAVQLAFPRSKMADVTYDGRKLAARGLVPPGVLGRDWSVDETPFDPEEARRELRKSSYAGAAAVPPLRIYGASHRGAEALRDALKTELGLRVEVVGMAWNAFNDGLSQRSFPGYELLWGADYPDPESFLWSLFGADSPNNFLSFRNDDFDALLSEAAETLDIERRGDLYEAAQRVLLRDDVVVPLYHDVRYTLVRPYVRGLKVTALGILGLEHVWLER